MTPSSWTPFGALAAAVLSVGPTARVEDPPAGESLVRTAGAILEPVQAQGTIPEGVRARIDRQNDRAKWAAEELAREARAHLERRNDATASRLREAAARSERDRAARGARRQQASDRLNSRLEAASGRLRSEVDRLTQQNAALKADWERRGAQDQREFRSRWEADLASRLAEGKKRDDMVVAALTMGAGSASGGVVSSLLGAAGGGAGPALGSEAGLGTIEGTAGMEPSLASAAGSLPAAAAPELAAFDDLGEMPVGPLIASLEGAPGQDRILAEAIPTNWPRQSSEIARVSGLSRPMTRQVRGQNALRRYPTNRDPRRTRPAYTPYGNGERPVLPEPHQQAGHSALENVSEYLDRSQSIENTWTWLDSFSTSSVTGRFPPAGWHPPMAYPAPAMLARVPDYGPVLSQGSGPMLQSDPVYLYTEVGPEGFKVYRQGNREIVVPLD